MGGILDEKSMDAKIRNAVYSVGVEEGHKGPPGYRFPAPVEWRTMVLKLDDLTFDGKCNIESSITTALNEGWYFNRNIVCQPYVILVFWRQGRKESEEK